MLDGNWKLDVQLPFQHNLHPKQELASYNTRILVYQY